MRGKTKHHLAHKTITNSNFGSLAKAFLLKRISKTKGYYESSWGKIAGG
jgi:hypothetical protein